jgi:hypothetical protein
MSYTKEKAISIIHKSAIEYNQNLINKNVLFLYTHNNKYDYLECSFTNNNFLHLTGVETDVEPMQFYNAALNNKISVNDFDFKSDGTTELKLSVLLKLMNIHKVGRMIGDYNYCGRWLVADRLAGTTTSVMGFIKDNNYFYPSSILKENLSNISKKPYSKIIASFIKSQKEELYNELCYAIKDHELITEKALKLIEDKIDFKNLNASFEIPECINKYINLL